MNKRAIIFGALLFTVVAAALSFLVIKPVKPIIEIRGEPLVSISGHGAGIMDFVILNTMFTAWVMGAMLIGLWVLIMRGKSMVPSGLYNAGEAVIELIYDFVISIAGEVNAKRFFPLIATLLIYIAFANWMSLTPLFNSVGMFVPLHAEEDVFHEHAIVFKDSGAFLILPGAEEIEIHAEDCAAGHDGDECREHAIEEATAELGDSEEAGVLFPFLRGINTDLMTTASFAIVAVLFIEYWGITTLGFFTYMGKFINFKGPIDFAVGILEFVAEVARLISFSFRLFGNMLAGEILLLVMAFLVPLVSTVLLPFYMLELFVGVIQAFVFAALTLVFAVLAVTHHGSGAHDESAEGAEHAAHH